MDYQHNHHNCLGNDCKPNKAYNADVKDTHAVIFFARRLLLIKLSDTITDLLWDDYHWLFCSVETDRNKHDETNNYIVGNITPELRYCVFEYDYDEHCYYLHIDDPNDRNYQHRYYDTTMRHDNPYLYC